MSVENNIIPQGRKGMNVIKKKPDQGYGTSLTYQSDLKLNLKQMCVENLVIF